MKWIRFTVTSKGSQPAFLSDHNSFKDKQYKSNIQAKVANTEYHHCTVAEHKLKSEKVICHQMLLSWSSGTGSVFQSLCMNCYEGMGTYFACHCCWIWNTKTCINFRSAWFWALVGRWNTNRLQINRRPRAINNAQRTAERSQRAHSSSITKGGHTNMETGSKTSWNEHKLLLHLHCSLSLLIDRFLLGRWMDFLMGDINKKLIHQRQNALDQFFDSTVLSNSLPNCQ